jgi:hypothetical protein
LFKPSKLQIQVDEIEKKAKDEKGDGTQLAEGSDEGEILSN